MFFAECFTRYLQFEFKVDSYGRLNYIMPFFFQGEVSENQETILQ